MALNPKQFGTIMKNARMDKKLTQAELAEILDLSLSYLKDLERFKNTPSLEVFAKTIQYFNLSADTVIYPDKNLNNSTYQKIQRRLLQCDEKQLKIILALIDAVLSVDDTPTDNSKISSTAFPFSIIPIPLKRNMQSTYPWQYACCASSEALFSIRSIHSLIILLSVSSI